MHLAVVLGPWTPAPVQRYMVYVPWAVDPATEIGVMRYRTISSLHVIAPIISLGLPFELPYQNWPTLIKSGRGGKPVLPDKADYMSAVVVVSMSANSM